MLQRNSVVAIFNSHTEAESAIQEIKAAGFDMKQLSIIGKDYHTEEHVVGYYNTENRMRYWGKLGAFWGGIWGFIFGSGFFLIPGIGPVLVGGHLVSCIVGALEGAVIYGGLSALGAGLYSLGIPKDSILAYETALRSDKFLLIAHGTTDQVRQAKEILDRTNSESVHLHQDANLEALASEASGGKTV